MSATADDPQRAAAPGREMLIELVGLHARALLRMPWVQALLVLGVGLFTYSYIPPLRFCGWAVLTVSVEVLRARYAARVLRRGHDIDPRRVHARFVLLAAAAGASIGLGGAAFLPLLPILHQALFGAVMFAIPAAGVAVSHSSRYILAAYTICILLPSSAAWAAMHPSQSLGLAALSSLYCAVLILAAADGEKLLLRSVIIRHERDRLVLDLQEKNAQVQAAMAQSEQSAQARARVLAAASHDLRQPLHALSVYSAVLAANPAPETLHELSGNIDQIVRALGSLLNGLLDLSRLSAGYYVPERQPLALERVVAEVCAEYRQAAAQRGLDLTSVLDPVRLTGDAVAIGRIARNLIDNALKYTERGAVHVSTALVFEGAAAVAVLAVVDTGRGIPASEQGRIFEEFYQLDNPGRDRSRGVGLGLAIVQRLCELIGASVRVESTLGQGTRFEVRIPAAPEGSTQPAPALPEDQPVPLHGKRVYVVDDEADILKSMQALLRVWGIEASGVNSPAAAEQLFAERGPPDLMIVDLRLREGEHGAHLADRLQRGHGGFPVLIITGETSSEALRDANRSGYTLLQKPIAPEVLQRAIAGMIVTHAAGEAR